MTRLEKEIKKAEPEIENIFKRVSSELDKRDIEIEINKMKGDNNMTRGKCQIIMDFFSVNFLCVALTNFSRKIFFKKFK